MFSSSIGVQLPLANIVINLVISSFLGGFISWIYTKTHRGSSFSYSFIQALVLTTVIACVVMMVIGNNLARAFGLVGAFSIIRFRTAIKEVRDIIFIFLSVVTGMAVGSNNYSLAIAGVGVVSFLSFLFTKIPVPFSLEPWYLLSLRYKKADLQPLEKLLREHTMEYLILTMNPASSGSGVEVLYHIKLKKHHTLAVFVEALHKSPQIENPQLNVERNLSDY